jgi:hypothetical protein
MKQRMKDQDPFIGRVMADSKIMLIGNENDLQTSVEIPKR